MPPTSRSTGGRFWRSNSSCGKDGDDFDFHPQVRPNETVDDAEHGGGLVVDGVLAHREVGGHMVTAAEPLAHVDNVGELGASLGERVLDVGPALPRFVGEVFRRCAIFTYPRCSGNENSRI